MIDVIAEIEKLEELHPPPFLVGERMEDVFEESLESVIDKEWVKFNKEYYYA